MRYFHESAARTRGCPPAPRGGSYFKKLPAYTPRGGVRQLAPAALASCVCDALVAVAVAAIFGWALRVELAFTAAVAFAAVCSLMAGALVLGRYRETGRAPGMARLSREEIIARDAPMALGRAASVAVPALLAAVLMLILGPSPVRAVAVPVLAGALSCLLSATQITGRVWACLGARRKRSK